MLGVIWSLVVVYVSAIFSVLFLWRLPKSRHLALAFLIGGELLAVSLTRGPRFGSGRGHGCVSVFE